MCRSSSFLLDMSICFLLCTKIVPTIAKEHDFHFDLIDRCVISGYTVHVSESTVRERWLFAHCNIEQFRPADLCTDKRASKGTNFVGLA